MADWPGTLHIVKTSLALVTVVLCQPPWNGARSEPWCPVVSECNFRFSPLKMFGLGPQGKELRYIVYITKVDLACKAALLGNHSQVDKFTGPQGPRPGKSPWGNSRGRRVHTKYL